MIASTFQCDLWFAVLWTFGCFCGGWLVSFWVLAMCRASGRADECSECLRRRQETEALKTKRRTPRSHCCNAPAYVHNTVRHCTKCGKPTSPHITPPGCGLPEEGANVPQRAGITLSGKLRGAILDPLYPAPDAATGPEAGTSPRQTPPSNEGQGAGHTL